MKFSDFEKLPTWELKKAVWDVNLWFYEKYQELLDDEQLAVILGNDKAEFREMVQDWEARMGVPTELIVALIKAKGGVVY